MQESKQENKKINIGIIGKIKKYLIFLIPIIIIVGIAYIVFKNFKKDSIKEEPVSGTVKEGAEFIKHVLRFFSN